MDSRAWFPLFLISVCINFDLLMRFLYWRMEAKAYEKINSPIHWSMNEKYVEYLIRQPDDGAEVADKMSASKTSNESDIAKESNERD